MNRFVPAHLQRPNDDKLQPVVRCPGCKTAMAPSHPKKLPHTADLQEITYTCKSCGMTTKRSIKADR